MGKYSFVSLGTAEKVNQTKSCAKLRMEKTASTCQRQGVTVNTAEDDGDDEGNRHNEH